MSPYEEIVLAAQEFRKATGQPFNAPICLRIGARVELDSDVRAKLLEQGIRVESEEKTNENPRRD